MDIVLLLLGLFCMIVGLLGSFLPVLPGPGLSSLGLLFLFATQAIPANYWAIGISLLLALILTLLDYIIPAQGTKRYGGSTYGVWGTHVGLLIGLLSPIPLGFIIGPFIGALVGELLYNSQDHHRAIRAASGSFIGFLASSFLKFVVCSMHLGYFIWLVWQYKSIW